MKVINHATEENEINLNQVTTFFNVSNAGISLDKFLAPNEK